MTASSTRHMDVETTLRHIGWANICAISGLRYSKGSDSTVILPVSNGYSVWVTLAADDTYTVDRVWRSGYRSSVYRVEGVYADRLGDVAYSASCFRDKFGTKVV